jgi:hypothetical protein
MGHFQRWLEGLIATGIGLLLIIAGALTAGAGVIYDSPATTGIGFVIVASGAILCLWGNYRMEEEKPQGRFKVER